MLTMIRIQFRKKIRWNCKEDTVVSQTGHVIPFITIYDSSSAISCSISGRIHTVCSGKRVN